MHGTFYIDDTLTFYVQCSRFSTGEAYDASAAPSYRVYEQTTNTPILTGNSALLDDSNTTGLYAGSITLSAANGFEVGKCYCVRVAATVDSVAAADIVAQFVMRAKELDGDDGGDTTGRRTTPRGQIAGLYRELVFNKRSCPVGNGTRTTYKDDEVTAMTTSAVTVTGTTVTIAEAT